MGKFIKIGGSKNGDVSFDMARSGNRHIAICGKSGSGKSVAGQKIIKSIIESGGTAVVFDMHWLFDPDHIFVPIRADIEKMMNETDAFSSGISFPLFTPLRYADGTMEDELDVVTSITDILTGSMKLKCRQKEDLFRALQYVAEENVYGNQGIAALNEALYMVDSEVAANVQDKMRYILNKNVLRDGTGFIEENRINVLRLSKFTETTQALIAEILLTYIWRLANTGIFLKEGLYLFCDECQNLNLGRSGIIDTILAEGRKLGLHLILITQSLGGSCRTRVAQCLLQTGQQLYFMPSEGEASIIAKMIHAARYKDWQMVLKTLKVGECVAVGSLSVDETAYNRPLKINI